MTVLTSHTVTSVRDCEYSLKDKESQMEGDDPV